MTAIKSTPDAVTKIRVTQIICDLKAGPLRCVAQLAVRDGLRQPKAIWRNEVGVANCTTYQPVRS